MSNNKPKRLAIKITGAVALGVLTLLIFRWPGPFELWLAPVLTFKELNDRTYVYNRGKLLAVYNNAGNTFIQFWYKGRNVIGGFSSGTPGSNNGGPVKGHSSDYPFGWLANGGVKPQWQGFWAGFSYKDVRWKEWKGINGNPFALKSFTATQPGKSELIFTVKSRIDHLLLFPLFECEVLYSITPQGIGVKNTITILGDLTPDGSWDLAGQLIMTQADCDLDPAAPYTQAGQPDLFFKLALTNGAVNIDPFPPYQIPATPSNMYGDPNLPDSALVPMNGSLAFISPFESAGPGANLALRVDLKRSTLPPLEYYCEYNGERDYVNFLFSPAVGTNRSIKTVPKGTKWVLYGDMVPWEGADPKTLFKRALLSDALP